MKPLTLFKQTQVFLRYRFGIVINGLTLKKPTAFLDIIGSETERLNALKKESTVRLVMHIVEDADRLALRVLLETRRLFHLLHEPPLLLPEFLMKLRDRIASPDKYDADDCRLADCTYDLTIARYSNFPEPIKKSPDPGTRSLIGTGVDCRKYYRAFLQTFSRERKRKKIKSQSQQEFEAGRLLQRLVWRNFWWSRKECERGTPFSVRYAWKVGGVKIYLWYPSYMTAKEFKAWLEENVKDFDLKALSDIKRIQSLINENLSRGYHVSEDESGVVSTLRAKDEASSIDTQEGYMFGRNLADTVAQEKAGSLHKLRPAIRELGEESVRRLILQIFSEIELDDYDLTRTARQYGISKATLSRFAGSSWFEKMDGVQTVTVPDLWRNTAGVLAQNPVFLDTVLASGFEGKLKEVLGLIDSGRRERE